MQLWERLNSYLLKFWAHWVVGKFRWYALHFIETCLCLWVVKLMTGKCWNIKLIKHYLLEHPMPLVRMFIILKTFLVFIYKGFTNVGSKVLLCSDLVWSYDLFFLKPEIYSYFRKIFLKLLDQFFIWILP